VVEIVLAQNLVYNANANANENANANANANAEDRH
jgi:hypothetical protein